MIHRVLLHQKVCNAVKFSRSIGMSLVERNENKPNVIEERNISKSDSEENNILVGPPHPVSNLRLKIFPNSKNLTTEEQFFYAKSREIQEWNQQYWETHNKDFSKCKASYIKEIAKKNQCSEYTPNSDEMANFYQQFLNRNYKKHVSYNWQWYRKNLYLIYLSAIAQFSKLKRSIKRNTS